MRVVLVGAGHAHVEVLRSFAARPEPAAVLTVVSPHARATYTGMVPGVIAGQYALAEAQIDVADLARRAGAAFVRDRVGQIDAASKTLGLEHGDRLEYDVVSFNIGAWPAAGAIAADAPVVWVKPIEAAVSRIEQLLALPPAPGGRKVVIAGAGAGGVELSFALRTRLRGEQGAEVTLCDRQAIPAAERGVRAARLVGAALAAHGISFVGGCAVARVERDAVVLEDSRRLRADIIVWSTGAGAPALFDAAHLPVDEHGFLRVDATLRCVGQRDILGAGDAVALEANGGRSHRLPKAGVFAVRQGPVLAANLRLIARGGSRLQVYQPQRRFLSLLNTCDGRAILSYGHLAAHTRWALRLKDRIDRGFVARFRTRPDRPLAT